MFDVTNWESFENIQKWLNEVKEREPNVPYKLILGNKCDQESRRVITFDAANEFANKLNIPYLETSAKDAVNVDQAFFNMASEIKAHFMANSLQNSNNGATLHPDLSISRHKENNSNTSCCQIL